MPTLSFIKAWQQFASKHTLKLKSGKPKQQRPIDSYDSRLADESRFAADDSRNDSDNFLPELPTSPDTELLLPGSFEINEYSKRSTLRYKPLNQADQEIRVLVINSNPNDENVSCSLQHFSCSHEFPEYTALSYCWGSLRDAVQITVDGSHVSVTKNLAAALCALRSNGHSRIWIDALCINQKDKVERSHQILRMNAIYRNATNTIAWLGPDEKGKAEIAFDRLRLLATRNPRAEFETAIAELFTGYMAWRTDPGWSAIKTLMEFPYWQRTWIIQELALSRSVVFWWGQASISLDNLDAAMASLRERKPKDYFESGYKDILYLLVIVGKTRKRDGKEPKGMNLERVLTFSCRSKASEPRDKIFGVLGLSADGSRLIPNPDYEKPLDDILRELTISTIRRHNGDSRSKLRPLDLICVDNPTIPKQPDLSSWVTDWPSIWNGSAGNFWSSSVERGLQSGYSACGISPASLRFSEDGMTLTVRGYVFDRVHSLSAVHLIRDSKPKTFLSPGMSDSNLEQGSELSVQQNVYGDEAGLYEAIWRSLIADRINQKKGQLSIEKAPSSYGSHFRYLWSDDSKRPKGERLRLTYECLQAVRSFMIYGRSLEEWSLFTPSGQSPGEKTLGYDVDVQDFGASPSAADPEPDGMEFIYACKFRDMFHRRVLTTRKGYVGLAHAQSEIGDMICLIQGCTIPMILRPCDRGYRVIGDAYVHGIMSGEFWHRQDVNSIQEFDLK